MLRSFLLRQTPKVFLPHEEEILFHNISKQVQHFQSMHLNVRPLVVRCMWLLLLKWYHSQNNRETFYRDNNESVPFIEIDSNNNELKYNLEHLETY